MSWAEIKSAVNSTLGTEDFKPLNELILGERSLVSSDNAFAVLENNGSATVLFDGVMKVKFTLGFSHRDGYSSWASVDLNISDSTGNIYYRRIAEENLTEDEGSRVIDFDVPINVRKGETYTVSAVKDQGGLSVGVRHITFCGTIVMASSIIG